MKRQSQAFKTLSSSTTPEKMQELLNTLSLYKIYTKFGISEQLLKKYIEAHNLSFSKAFRTIHDLTEEEKAEIIETWVGDLTTPKRDLLKKFNIGPTTLHKLLSQHGIPNREHSQVDPAWQDYNKLVRRLTDVVKRHYKLRPKLGFDWDHKFSVRDGFLNNIPPGVIASLPNLELIPVQQNRANGHESSITVEELYTSCNITPLHKGLELQQQQDVAEHPSY